MKAERESELRGLDWYALTVRAGAERNVVRIIGRWGHYAMVPTVIRWRRVNRYQKQKHAVAYPLLARYVFLGLRPGATRIWYDLGNLSLVHSVVGFGDQPSRLVISEVIDFLSANGEGQLQVPKVQRFMRTHREFAVGDEVEIVEGAFTGTRVKVEAITGTAARILLPFLGSVQEVSVPLANLEKAD